MKSLIQYLQESKLDTSTIIFCPCGSDKDEASKTKSIKAEDLYTGSLSQKSIAYAKKKYPNNPIYILSAKWGLLPLDKKIKYYDEYLGDFSVEEVKKWKDKILKQLSDKHIDIEHTKFIFLTGSSYYEPFQNDSPMKHISIPMEKCTGLGYMIQWLDKRI